VGVERWDDRPRTGMGASCISGDWSIHWDCTLRYGGFLALNRCDLKNMCEIFRIGYAGMHKRFTSIGQLGPCGRGPRLERLAVLSEGRVGLLRHNACAELGHYLLYWEEALDSRLSVDRCAVQAARWVSRLSDSWFFLDHRHSESAFLCEKLPELPH